MYMKHNIHIIVVPLSALYNNDVYIYIMIQCSSLHLRTRYVGQLPYLAPLSDNGGINRFK